MIVTTYICDRCGAEQKTNTQMWSVGVHLIPAGRPRELYSHAKPPELWCTKCANSIELFNYLTPKKAAEQNKPAPKSLSEQLLEILRQAIREEMP